MEEAVILITGASGYFGSHLTRRLVESGKPVRALVRSKKWMDKEGRLAGLPVDGPLDLVEGDVTRPETLQAIWDGVTAVIHTVAIAIEKGGRSYSTVNYQGTVNMVDAAKKAGVRRFLYMSQLGAASQIPYRFLASKGKAQEYVVASGLDWTVFRPSVIWGPEDEFANTFARLVPLTPLIFPIVGDENAVFQPIWVEDVVTCFAKSLDDSQTIGREYEIGGPEVLSLEEIERRTLQALGVKRWMVHFPMPVLRLAVTLMEAIFPAPPVTRSLLELLAIRNVTSHNDLNLFVSNPLPFTAKNASGYMRNFRVKETLAQFFGR